VMEAKSAQKKPVDWEERKARVIKAIEAGHDMPRKIQDVTGLSKSPVVSCLSRLMAAKRVKRIRNPVKPSEFKYALR
jgi:predicted transcriptional regulator